MQVFNSYFKIIRRYIPLMLVYLVIFTIFGLMFSTQKSDLNFNESKPNIFIVNHDQDSVFTSAFVDFMKDHATYVEIGSSEEEIQDALFYEKVKIVFVIPKGFSEEFLNGGDNKITTYKTANQQDVFYVEMLFNKFLNISKVYASIGMSEEEIVHNVLKDMEIKSEVIMQGKKQNAKIDSLAMFYNYTNYTFLAIILYVVSLIMSSFREKNIRKRNLVSPFSEKKINAQLLMGNMCITLIIWFVFALLAYLLYGSVLFTNAGLLILLNSLVFVISALSLAFLIGNIVNSKAANSAIANVISLGTSFIAGAFIAQEFLNSTVLTIAKIFPSYYYIRNNNLIKELSGYSFIDLKPILINMGIILCFAIGYFIITNIILKNKKD